MTKLYKNALHLKVKARAIYICAERLSELQKLKTLTPHQRDEETRLLQMIRDQADDLEHVIAALKLV